MEGQAWPSPSHCPPKGAAGRSPPLGQLKAEGGWAGGPDLPRGHRGVCAWETGVWEGGIYRLLFTKTRPRKTFNSSQLKGDSCGTLTLPLLHTQASAAPALARPHPCRARPAFVRSSRSCISSRKHLLQMCLHSQTRRSGQAPQTQPCPRQEGAAEG